MTRGKKKWWEEINPFDGIDAKNWTGSEEDWVTHLFEHPDGQHALAALMVKLFKERPKHPSCSEVAPQTLRAVFDQPKPGEGLKHITNAEMQRFREGNGFLDKDQYVGLIKHLHRRKVLNEYHNYWIKKQRRNAPPPETAVE